MHLRYPAEEIRLASQDSLEGPKAFAEKRPPRWRGF
jgi:1,4-dihydroxy-2-naphthoyl-CoA synthase